MGISNQQKSGGKKAAGGMLGVVLLLAYWFLQPVLNEQLGLNLPSLRGTNPAAQQAEQKNQQSEATEFATPKAGLEASGEPDAGDQVEPETKLGTSQTSTATEKPPGAKDSASTDSGKKDSANNAEVQGDSAAESDLLHGMLREVQPDRYMSPAGLVYGPGSQEGHRLKHLERHTIDQPTRPGSHGVFDGGMSGALKVIDEGFAKTKSGGSGITTEEEGDRTIYTISMGKRIGFVGGRDGNRRNKPMARRLRIVLEGNRVITAFPL